jgi:hypothetical protein
VSAESVAQILECAECGRPWLPADVERWAAYRAEEPDEEQPLLMFFCPGCAEREFGDSEV